MGVAKDIQTAIRTITEQAITDAPFDKTRRGVVRGINEDNNTYTVHVDGMTYDGVKSTNGSAVHIGDVVDVTYPTNNTSQMVISGITDMTQSEIDDFVQSLGLHGRSICPYDVGDIYETTNSANPSTKWDGTTWNLVSEAADYIVEEGASGIWTYRKWASGIAECWGTYFVASSTYANGGSKSISQTLPITFSDIPSVVTSGSITGTTNSGTRYTRGNNSTTIETYLNNMSGGSVTNTGYVYFYVVGIWKTRTTPQTIYKWRRVS